MRILLANDVPLERGHGTEHHVVALAGALRERGHVVEVLTGQRWERPLEEEPGRLAVPDLTAPLLRKRPYRNLRNVAAALERVRRLVAKFDPDVIHVHNLLNPFALRELRGLRPVVKSVHDCRPFCSRPPPAVASRLVGAGERFCDRTFGPGCWPRCYLGASPARLVEDGVLFAHNAWALREVRRYDRLVVYSDYLRDLAERSGVPPGRVELVHHFTDLPVVDRAELPADGGRRILFVGSFGAEKGVRHLLRALRNVARPVELTMVGDGLLRGEVAASAAGIPGLRVSLPGYLSRDLLAAEYRSALFVVLPSIGSEGCPLVGLEALASGKPVIGFDVGGVREWLVDGLTGHLVPRQDVEALGAKIAELLDRPAEVLRMGEAGRELLRRKFRRDLHIDRLLAIYGDAIAARRDRLARPTAPAGTSPARSG